MGSGADVVVARRRPPTILVMDGEPQVRHLLRMGLERHGFQVHVAADGPEALALYRRCAGDIELFLLEVQPQDETGLETFTAIRKLNPRARCCFLSPTAGRYTQRQLLSLGATQVFEKPFSLAMLTRALQELAGV